MDNYEMNVPKHWRENIRECFLTGYWGTPEEREKATEDLEYAYHYYAPAFLYKYYTPKMRNLESIKNNKFWYAPPKNFNDPFDSDFPVNQDLFFNSLIKQSTEGKGIRVGSAAWKEMHAETPKIVTQVKEFLDAFRQTMAITCFSENDDSLLMWSHYGYNHQGICVAYELQKIYSELDICPVPVVYTNDRVCLTLVDLNNVENSSLSFLAGSLTTKSPEWSYEAEWRIVCDGTACSTGWDASKGALFPAIKPAAITFGCAADENDEFWKEVEAYCRENSINLYQMEKHETEYRLIRKPVVTFEP